jgi:hypothetical protein
LQRKSNDDDIMHSKSLSVKENVAASAQNLATSPFCAFHFERMLYDNSQLARLYLYACRLRVASPSEPSPKKYWTTSFVK